MAPESLNELRAFFACIEPQLAGVIDVMYGRLFDAVPEAQTLFKGDMQEQKRRFVLMLQSIVKLTRSSHLWPVSTLSGHATLPSLNGLKSRHAQAGVTPSHFGVMHAVLSDVCAKAAPDKFTPKVSAALAFVFDVLARSLTVPHDADALARKTAGRAGADLVDPARFLGSELTDDRGVQASLN